MGIQICNLITIPAKQDKKNERKTALERSELSTQTYSWGISTFQAI